MQPKYLAILTFPLKANEKTISRCKKGRDGRGYDFCIIFVYFLVFIIIFVYLFYIFTFLFIWLANRQ